jgi:trimethylamine--corrinoid protein Co-methyltransferase
MRDEIYGLPIWAFAGASDSKLVDAQAGAECMLSVITAMLSRCNVIHDVGYIESGHTSSLEMLVMADELVDMSRFFVEGLSVNESTLALDVIDRVARSQDGAFFLADDHTFENFKTAHCLPELMDRSRYESWAQKGGEDLFARCNAKARRILSEHRVIPKPIEILEDINQVLHSENERMN